MAFPATTLKVVSIEPQGPSKVKITMEMVVDVNRLAEVASQLISASVAHTKAEKAARRK